MHETETSDKYFPKFIVGDDILNAHGTNSSNNESKLVQNKFRDKDFIEYILLKCSDFTTFRESCYFKCKINIPL